MDRIQRCAKKYGELFGGKPVQDQGNDPEFMRALQRFIFGEVCYAGSLDNRMRELITVTVLAVNQTLPQLKAHTKAALNVGCSPVEIREAVYQCAPVIGFPKTLNAIAAMDEVFTSAGIALPLESRETVDDADRYEAGRGLQAELLETAEVSKYDWLPEAFREALPAFLTEFCFGDYLTRGGLDLRTRTLLSLTALAAQGGNAEQLCNSAAAAIKAGNDREQIVCALVHAMPYCGVPLALAALDAIKTLFE